MLKVDILGAAKALRGGSSNQAYRFRRLADPLPALLRQRLRLKTVRKRQVQRRLTREQAKQLIAEYQDGASMQKIAKRWELHRTTVAEHLRRAGIQLRRQGIQTELLEEAATLYARGWSCRRLAERYGCNSETVRQALMHAGVKMRAPWERPK